MSENENKVTTTSESDNPMPKNKAGAATIKVLIGLAAVGDVICSAYSCYCKRNSRKVEAADGNENNNNEAAAEGEKHNKQIIQTLDGISLALTLVDFGLSCGVGYGIYSPMDTSDKTLAASKYGEKIAATSEACGKYTNIWILKTVISLFVPSIAFVTSFDKWKLEGAQADKLDNADYASTIFGGILACVSAVLESMACAEAGKVGTGDFTSQQKRDKQCFLCETIGFILDDARAVADAVIEVVGAGANVYAEIVRETFAVGYAVSMFTESGLIAQA